MYGQGLHGVLGAVHLGGVAQYAFIDGARGGELEVRVVGVAHVGKVLVREQLDDARGHIGQSRLAVVAVPHGAAGESARLLGDIRLHNVGEVARGMARQCGMAQASVVVAGGIDAEGAYGGVVFADACIGVQPEG